MPEVDLHVIATGESLEQAKAAMIMLHGRGASAEDILLIVPEIQHPGFAYLAPQASNNSWYPNSFLAPLQANEPYLSQSLSEVSNLVTHISEAGIPYERIFLLGFSQGACLALEYAARNARRYGGVAGLSGGLIGPDHLERDYQGSLEGTPIFLGCSDRDPHIPKHRVEHTAQVLGEMDASVSMRLYPYMGHTINEDELSKVRDMIASNKYT